MGDTDAEGDVLGDAELESDADATGDGDAPAEDAEGEATGAPLADEIVFILAMSTGPRVHARMAGLAASAISLWDGLR